MRSDEFNNVTITNEKERISNLEFGRTQNVEFKSYRDNKINIKNEINDNVASNSERPPKNENLSRKDKELKEDLKKNDNSSQSGSSSSSISIAAVGATALVTITTISTLVGLNLYVRASVMMNSLNVTPVSLSYNLDLLDTENDDFIITLENKVNNYYSYQDLLEGNNEGDFIDLSPSTTFSLSVVDITQNNYVIYQKDVTTGDAPAPAPTYKVNYYIGDTLYRSEEIKKNTTLSYPEDTKLVYNNTYFSYWTLDNTVAEPVPYPFNEEVSSDLNLYGVYINECPISLSSFTFIDQTKKTISFNYSKKDSEFFNNVTGINLSFTKGNQTLKIKDLELEDTLDKNVITNYEGEFSKELYKYSFELVTKGGSYNVSEGYVVPNNIQYAGFSSVRIGKALDKTDKYGCYFLDADDHYYLPVDIRFVDASGTYNEIYISADEISSPILLESTAPGVQYVDLGTANPVQLSNITLYYGDNEYKCSYEPLTRTVDDETIYGAAFTSNVSKTSMYLWVGSLVNPSTSYESMKIKFEPVSEKGYYFLSDEYQGTSTYVEDRYCVVDITDDVIDEGVNSYQYRLTIPEPDLLLPIINKYPTNVYLYLDGSSSYAAEIYHLNIFESH